MYLEVAPVVPLAAWARSLYTYHLFDAEDGNLLYRLVEISFGKRRVRGVIMARREQVPPFPTQPIRRLLPAHLTNQQVEFGRWIARTMQGGLGYTLRLFISSRL